MKTIIAHNTNKHEVNLDPNIKTKNGVVIVIVWLVGYITTYVINVYHH